MDLKWLHLSDLHLIYKNYDTKVMRTSFLDYLQQHFSGKIDCLFITGDISDKGEEYTTELEDFLNEIVNKIQISKDSVYMIPGNHDIKRNGLMGHVIKSILANDDPKKAINEIDKESFDVLYNGQKDFMELYKRFLGREYPKDSLHFVIKTERYNVLHINSCLIAGGDNVEGNILIGLEKLLTSLQELEKEKVIFALGHHTANCINEAEQRSFLNRLSDSEIDLYLCGHVHKSKIHQEVNNYNSTHMFTAGANVVDGFSDTIFIEGKLEEATGKAEVIYHTWNVDNEFWHVNNSLDRRLVSGKYEFEIEKIKKKVEIPKTPSVTPKFPEFENINGLEFKNFMVNFFNVLSQEDADDYKENFNPKDVTDKFRNMLCSKTLRVSYDRYSIFFPIVNQIFKSSSFVGFEKKYLIPSLISKYYMKALHKYNNGDEIFVTMTEMIAEKYSQQVGLEVDILEIYISILVCWEIHECNIYNENKREVS